MIGRRHQEATAESEAEAMIASERADLLADYLNRGRRFESLSREQLETAWASALVAIVDAVARREKYDMLEWFDLGVEFEIRDLPEPTHLVPQAMAKLREMIKKEGPNAPQLLDAARRWRKRRQN